MVVLGRSEILAVFKLSSAILADFDMRGSAASVWTLAGIALLSSFLCLLFIDSFRPHLKIHRGEWLSHFSL
jgi:hypothetical protein